VIDNESGLALSRDRGRPGADGCEERKSRS